MDAAGDGVQGISRRQLLRAGAGVATAAALPAWMRFGPIDSALAARRPPNSLPDPLRPAGQPTDALPFDHIVVCMMENHSFDNYFGMLARSGQPRAHGFRFRHGKPSNTNPVDGGYVRAYHAPSMCQPGVSQSWNSTHRQINGGAMDGFARDHAGSMSYWAEDDLPFYYSLAKNFTLANRWFGSAPCQTYPNRRFLLAGTANGLISTDANSIFDPPPANGTIFDRLNAHGISWRNYFSDLPATGVISSIPMNNLTKLSPIAQFHADCAAGTLPAVSIVDPEFGLAGEVGGGLSALPIPGLGTISAQGGDEENPQDITIGENFVSSVLNAVLASPAWPRTLFIWLYDEHGGYYDHVPPPKAVKPDNVAPRLGAGDVPGAYNLLGPRVPAVVASPYSKPGGVSNRVYDQTSVLATIEHKWNLPACTYRDANAHTVRDFLTRKPQLLEPPTMAAPGDLAASEAGCNSDVPVQKVHQHRHRGHPVRT